MAILMAREFWVRFWAFLELLESDGDEKECFASVWVGFGVLF